MTGRQAGVTMTGRHACRGDYYNRQTGVTMTGGVDTAGRQVGRGGGGVGGRSGVPVVRTSTTDPVRQGRAGQSEAILDKRQVERRTRTVEPYFFKAHVDTSTSRQSYSPPSVSQFLYEPKLNTFPPAPAPPAPGTPKPNCCTPPWSWISGAVSKSSSSSPPKYVSMMLTARW